MIFKEKTIGVISLGCDKNRVDTEKMLAILGSDKITSDIEKAQIIIINSCAFLESARKEALDAVFECDGYREKGKLEKLVLTGCLPQKYVGDIFSELPEVDIFLGISDYARLPEAIEEAYKGKRVNFVGDVKREEESARVVTTPLHYAYLKIADGCDNKCTYCLIPSIRGKYRSERIEDLLKEAEGLGDVAELILDAQDVTRYGEDLYGKPCLPELIRKLSALGNVGKIRILYAYPDKITDELIREMAENPKVIKYIYIPLQHADDAVLKRMNRKGTYAEYISLINELRERIDGIAIRSTFIAGFPGETEEQFDRLVGFLKEAKLENAGFFAYSREEGTPAYRLGGQLSEKVKNARVKKLYAVQRKISEEKARAYLGKEIEVLADGIDYDGQRFYGRAYFMAPDIDGKVYFTSDSEVDQGETYKVLIEKTDGYDFYGRAKNEFTE